MAGRSRIPKVLRIVAAIFISTAFALGIVGTNARETTNCDETSESCGVVVTTKYPINTWHNINVLHGRYFIFLSEILLIVFSVGLAVYRASWKKTERLIPQVIICVVCFVLLIIDGSLEMWYSSAALPNTNVESWSSAGAFLFLSAACFVIDGCIIFFEYRDNRWLHIPPDPLDNKV